MLACWLLTLGTTGAGGQAKDEQGQPGGALGVNEGVLEALEWGGMGALSAAAGITFARLVVHGDLVFCQNFVKMSPLMCCHEVLQGGYDVIEDIGCVLPRVSVTPDH